MTDGMQQSANIVNTTQSTVDSGIATAQGNAAAAQQTIQGGLDIVQQKIEFIRNSLSLIPRDAVPAVTMGMLAAAAFLIIVFFALCVFYIKSKPSTVIKKKEKKEEKKEEIVGGRVRHEDLPIISGRLGEILTLNGLLGAGPLTKTFFKIMEAIKNSTYDIRWRYKLPCFMIVGPEGSGKSTILSSLSFEYLTADGSSIDFMWRLFKKAAIFEFPRLETSEDANKFWPFLSELFMFIRPRRPLDGIILTLPADMLVANSPGIQKHAQETFDRIFAFQREVNFRLPIYLIITKMDLIPGFAEVGHLLDEKTKQQIFGWSNPY
ncbi:MAG: hypothetical protein LBT67_02350, partial [Holosporaceae bacterium]|nr:hypothetical protein [Holosporaceae bacterium]